MNVTDRLDDALAALVRKPARSDLRARVLARLAGAPSPARPRRRLAVVAAAASIAVLAPVAWHSFHRAPTPATVAVATPRAERAAAPAVGGSTTTPVPAAHAATPVRRADRAPAQPAATGGDGAAAETGLAVAPLAAPAAIRIEPIESAEPSAITSLTNDPLVVPPLDVETGSAGQEERP